MTLNPKNLPPQESRWQNRPLAARLTIFFVVLATTVFAETRVRVVNANITSGGQQSYDEGSGIRILRALQPDIVTMQEFNFQGNRDRDINELVEACCGKGFHFFRGAQGSESGIPNGIISRYPIVDSGEIADRGIHDRSTAWAKIELPNGKFLWAISAHLSHGSDDKREEGARRIVDFVRQKVPRGDLLVIGGDFNTSNRHERTLQVLSEVVTDQTIPVDTEGRSGTSANRSKPYDFVLPNPLLEQFHVCLNLLGRAAGGPPVKFPTGAVIDTRNFRDISKLAPARQGDSGALNMQHMAVAKDFEIPK